MPVYLHSANLIINKNIVDTKYLGGIEQFRIDYKIPFSEVNQEDDELFSLGKMNSDEFDIDQLISRGLSYDFEAQRSDDFTLVYRYGKSSWEVNWLEYNNVFAWHINISTDLKLKIEEICNMTMNDIIDQMESGNNLLRTIRLTDL